MQGTVPHDYYELCANLGAVLGSSGLSERKWNITPGAQIALLLHVAESLSLDAAAEVLRPLARARMDDAGNILPDVEPAV